MAGPRFGATVLLLFATVAAVMAGVGIYGVMAFGVGQRTREIGVRLALGASSRQVLRDVLGRTALVLIAGTATGIAAALTMSRGLTALLHRDLTARSGHRRGRRGRGGDRRRAGHDRADASRARRHTRRGAARRVSALLAGAGPAAHATPGLEMPCRRH